MSSGNLATFFTLRGCNLAGNSFFRVFLKLSLCSPGLYWSAKFKENLKYEGRKRAIWRGIAHIFYFILFLVYLFYFISFFSVWKESFLFGFVKFIISVRWHRKNDESYAVNLTRWKVEAQSALAKKLKNDDLVNNKTVWDLYFLSFFF